MWSVKKSGHETTINAKKCFLAFTKIWTKKNLEIDSIFFVVSHCSAPRFLRREISQKSVPSTTALVAWTNRSARTHTTIAQCQSFPGTVPNARAELPTTWTTTRSDAVGEHDGHPQAVYGQGIARAKSADQPRIAMAPMRAIFLRISRRIAAADVAPNICARIAKNCPSKIRHCWRIGAK